MSDKWQEYLSDPRKVCKYSAKCYQKNPDHHAQFKHPPQNPKRKIGSPTTITKRHKPQSSRELCEVEDKNELPSTGAFNIIESIKLPEVITYFDENVDKNHVLKESFLTDMPADFYKFYECIKSHGNVEKTLAAVNLQLIGPYDLLLGKLPILEDKNLYLIHWRFYYDPPEFQAVIKSKGQSEYHIGYYRDSPDDLPVFVASSNSAKDCHITPIATNIFGAVFIHLQNEKKRSPFVSMACQKLMDNIKKWAEEHHFPLNAYDIKKRHAKANTKTLHGAGIVVPYDRKTQIGYRKLVENDATIRKLFANLATAKSKEGKDKILSDLQPVITCASIAVDECDFGTGLEVGIDLFCSGLKELEPSAQSSLTSVYPLLNRDAFAEIIKAHLRCRRRGPDMSLLSLKN